MRKKNALLFFFALAFVLITSNANAVKFRLPSYQYSWTNNCQTTFLFTVECIQEPCPADKASYDAYATNYVQTHMYLDSDGCWKLP